MFLFSSEYFSGCCSSISKYCQGTPAGSFYLVLSAFIWFLCFYLVLCAFICFYLLLSASICFYMLLYAFIWFSMLLCIQAFFWVFFWFYLVSFGYIYLFVIISGYIWFFVWCCPVIYGLSVLIDVIFLSGFSLFFWIIYILFSCSRVHILICSPKNCIVQLGF